MLVSIAKVDVSTGMAVFLVVTGHLVALSLTLRYVAKQLYFAAESPHI